MSYPEPSQPTTGNWPGAPPPSATLAYSSITSGRPWLVTAIGITSIVVAGLSLLGALWTGLMYLPWLMMSATTISAGPAAVGAVGTTTPANTIAQVDADAIAAAMAGRQPLAPADQATLSQALQLAETPLSPPADGKWTPAHVMQQLSTTATWNDGTTSSTSFSFTNGGDISVAGGTVTVNVWRSNGDWLSTTVANGTATAGTPVNYGAVGPLGDGFGMWTGVVLVASFGLSLGLAVLLLVAGIQTLRSSPAGRALHLWWAIPKLAVALLAAYASYTYWTGMMGFAGGGGANVMAWGFALVPMGLSMAWPVTVLVLFLRARSLRDYYSEPEAPSVMMASAA